MLKINAFVFIASLALSMLAGANEAIVKRMSADTLYDRFTDAELVKLLSDEGYSSVEKLDDKYIAVKIDGRSYILINVGDGDLQGYYGMTGVTLDLGDVNDWNRERRLSRAYLDSDNDPVLESDLLSNGGMSEAQVIEFFRIFVDSANQFREFIAERDKS